MKQLKLEKIFIAAPSDVEEEFKIAEKVIEKFNKTLGDTFELRLEIHRGAMAVPSMGRPQGEILKQFNIQNCDYFIGILWARFGTPTGGKNNLTNQDFQSGTEEEFYTAYQSWREYSKPSILIYHCKRSVNYDKLDTEQFYKVQEFFKKFHSNGEHPGLYCSYNETNEFEESLFEHLFQIIKIKYQDNVMQSDKPILDITNESGFKSMYFPSSNDERNKAKKNLLLSSQDIRLIAFTGHSYLGLHGNRFINEVIEQLEKGARFRILLINQFSDVGKKVALAELNLAFEENSDKGILVNQTSGFHISLRGSLQGYQYLKKKYRDQIIVRFTEETITATVLLSENECFFEPYLYFDFHERMRKAMTSFEVQMSNSSTLYKTLDSMFETFWDRSKEISIDKFNFH